jgi:hypothetical protein
VTKTRTGPDQTFSKTRTGPKVTSLKHGPDQNTKKKFFLKETYLNEKLYSLLNKREVIYRLRRRLKYVVVI